MWVARGHVESPDIVINQARNENTLNIQESGPGSGSVLLSFISRKLILVKLCVAMIYIPQANLGQALYMSTALLIYKFPLKSKGRKINPKSLTNNSKYCFDSC